MSVVPSSQVTSVAIDPTLFTTLARDVLNIAHRLAGNDRLRDFQPPHLLLALSEQGTKLARVWNISDLLSVDWSEVAGAEIVRLHELSARGPLPNVNAYHEEVLKAAFGLMKFWGDSQIDWIHLLGAFAYLEGQQSYRMVSADPIPLRVGIAFDHGNTLIGPAEMLQMTEPGGATVESLFDAAQALARTRGMTVIGTSELVQTMALHGNCHGAQLLVRWPESKSAPILDGTGLEIAAAWGQSMQIYMGVMLKVIADTYQAPVRICRWQFTTDAADAIRAAQELMVARHKGMMPSPLVVQGIIGVKTSGIRRVLDGIHPTAANLISERISQWIY